jgi:hypothetical protein
MQKTFTVTRGTDVKIRIPLQRDGVDENFGSAPKVRFTIEGVLALSNEGDTPMIEVIDALDNEAVVTIAAAATAAVPVGAYRAECVVRLEVGDEQAVWEGEIVFRERLTAAIT